MSNSTEASRLAVVEDLLAAECGNLAELEALARVAKHVCGGSVETSISLVDGERQRQLFTSLGQLASVRREEALCEQTIATGRTRYIPDASADTLLRDNPYVDGRLASVRFYLSAPIVVASETVGSLCAFAPNVLTLDAEQVERLRDLATVAAAHLRMRRDTTRLQRQVVIDPLTGVCNRNILEDALQRFFSRGERGYTQPGILFVDLDRFKAVNDTYGHDVGDEVLRQTAHRLLRTVRAADLVIRMGGDEFVVLVDESPSADEARRGMANLAQRIRDSVSLPYIVNQHLSLELKASVGWALSTHPQGPSDSDSHHGASDLLHQADLAMYAEKRSVKSTH